MTRRAAVDIGAVDCAAIKTAGGKVRLRLLFTVEQLEALLRAARDDETQCNAMKRNETTESEQNREEVEGGGDDARARPPPSVASPGQSVFVIEGTRAWIAWKDYKSREKGFEWNLTTSRNHEGRSQTGWYFPSLFPPGLPGQNPNPHEGT